MKILCTRSENHVFIKGKTYETIKTKASEVLIDETNSQCHESVVFLLLAFGMWSGKYVTLQVVE